MADVLGCARAGRTTAIGASGREVMLRDHHGAIVRPNNPSSAVFACADSKKWNYKQLDDAKKYGVDPAAAKKD